MTTVEKLACSKFSVEERCTIVMALKVLAGKTIFKGSEMLWRESAREMLETVK